MGSARIGMKMDRKLQRENFLRDTSQQPVFGCPVERFARGVKWKMERADSLFMDKREFPPEL